MAASLPQADGHFGNQHPATANTEFNALNYVVQQILGRVNTATLVRVVTVTPGVGKTPGFVTVLPLVNQVDGLGQPVPNDVIYQVPFVRIQGGVSALIIDPVVGDVGLCIFCDHDISAAKAKGLPSNPSTKRRFDMSDGVYIGGWNHSAVPAQHYIQIDTTGITIEAGLSKVSTHAGRVSLIAASVDEKVLGPYAVTVPEFTINGNLHVTGIVHCTWEGDTIGVGFGGTGADLSTTGGASNVVMQETVGGKFTVKPISSISPLVLYTNTTPTPVDIGGIPNGSIFGAETMQQMWDMLLYPFQVPAFSTFSIQSQTTTLEVGNTTNADPNFLWTNTNHDNILDNSITITDSTAAETIATGLPNNGYYQATHAGITKTAAATEVYTIEATDSHSTVFTKTLTIRWEWMRYYGESVTATLDEAEIKGLRVGGLAAGYAGTYSFAYAPAEFKFLCYPASFGTATVFKDQATNLTVPFDTPYLVSVTNAHSVPTNYNVHRSTNQIGGAIVVVVS